MTVQFRSDIYAGCFDKAMDLLKMNDFNDAQHRGLQHLRALPNGIGLITGPAATGKTTLIITIIQSFLFSLSLLFLPFLPPLLLSPESNIAEFYCASRTILLSMMLQNESIGAQKRIL